MASPKVEILNVKISRFRRWISKLFNCVLYYCSKHSNNVCWRINISSVMWMSIWQRMAIHALVKLWIKFLWFTHPSRSNWSENGLAAKICGCWSPPLISSLCRMICQGYPLPEDNSELGFIVFLTEGWSESILELKVISSPTFNLHLSPSLPLL